MDFSLFYFANQAGDDGSSDKYGLMLESAGWADRNGFSRLWVPERHFHSFGGLSPNPSVLAAALAASTRRIGICSGSVVLPLHDPIRVAEEWSVVDNISGGRVGLGLACGWVPNDFVISGLQDSFGARKEIFSDKVERLRRLWRGEPERLINPQGEPIEVRTVPRPIQPELPIWITAAANPETFRQAGELGANLLTHLLGQTTHALAKKIQVYREAWRRAGHPAQGTLTLMLHTLVGEDSDEVHDLARGPMKKYLAGSLNLAAAHLESVPFLKNPGEVDLDAITPELEDQILEASFEKYFHMGSLLGSHEKCLDTVDELARIGVDEVACLIDFGVDADIVRSSLEHLNVVRVLANPRRLASTADASARSGRQRDEQPAPAHTHQ